MISLVLRSRITCPFCGFSKQETVDHEEFGASFKLINSATELHQTPFGTTQQFLYCLCKVG